MKDFLQDLVAHTHSLGFISLVKVTSDTNKTIIEAMAEDRSVIIQAETLNPVGDFEGTFGMPNLNKLDIHLKCPEYKENAQITVNSVVKDGETVLTGLHFENATGDFQNDYRFMAPEVVNEKLKSVKFKGATWNLEFEPSVGSIQRLKYQANAHTEETVFQVKTDHNDLIFNFGDSSTHAGSFIFESNVSGKLKQTWSWPVDQVVSILTLPGEATMRISDSGAMQITIDSGLAIYNYILPAQSK